jgi:arylsulfatase A-like enzyme
MLRRAFLGGSVGLGFTALSNRWAAQKSSSPNIVLIYADDIGYGDLSCYGATKVKTPNLDAIAKSGIRFTDAHCTSATCTPSRYGLITGQYPWRKKGTGVLPGDARLIIAEKQPTMPKMLQKAGYKTSVVGKWHLGLGAGNLDWNGLIQPGAKEVGFDESFLIPATGDRVPCVYVKNGRVLGLDPNDPISVDYERALDDSPTGRRNPELLKQQLTHGHDMTIVNGVSRIGFMKGGQKARWVDEDMSDTITREATEFIGRSDGKQPFFLYFATHGIHVPRVPHPRFAGTSACGTRCDVILELDDAIGKVTRTLRETGQLENTILMFSSDNGPVLDDGYADGAVEKLNGHRPSGPYRGNKYSKFEAGTRVPLLVSWPKKIKPGVSSALISQIDLYSSFAKLTGQTLSAEEAPDSLDQLSAFTNAKSTGRPWLVEHGNGLALREGNWKWIPPSEGAAVNKNTNVETGSSPQPQLYDLQVDPGETKNLAAYQSARVSAMSNLLTKVQQTEISRALVSR